MRTAWSIVRHSTTWWAGAVIAAVEVWLALSARTPGLNLWADLVTGLSTTSLFAGGIAAGFAALEAGRWAPVNTGITSTAARPPALIRLLHLAAAAVPVLAGYLLALVALGVYALTTGTYGAPQASWLIALGAVLIADVGFGWVIGSLGRGRWWVAPAAAVGFYALYVTVQALPLPRGLKALYPAILAGDYVFVQPVTATMLGITAFSIGITALVFLITRRNGSGATPRGVLVARGTAAALTTAGIIAAISTNGQYTDTYNPDEFTCQRSGTTVCLNPGYAAALPALHQQILAMNQRTAGTPLVATRIEQNIEGDPPPQDGARTIHIEQLADPSDVPLAVYRYVTEWGISSTCRNNGDYATGARLVIDTWLTRYNPAALSTPTEHRKYTTLQALPVDRSSTWLRQHYRQYYACTLTLDDLP